MIPVILRIVGLLTFYILSIYGAYLYAVSSDIKAFLIAVSGGLIWIGIMWLSYLIEERWNTQKNI